jgi:hypothetical protein
MIAISNSAGLSVRERFGDSLKHVFVNHVSDPRLGEHHDRMSISLQYALDLVHPNYVLGARNQQVLAALVWDV